MAAERREERREQLERRRQQEEAEQAETEQVEEKNRDPAPHVGLAAREIVTIKARSRDEYIELLSKEGTAMAAELEQSAAEVAEVAEVADVADVADVAEAAEVAGEQTVPSDADMDEALQLADAESPAVKAKDVPLDDLDHVELTAKDVPISPVAPPREAPIARLGRRLDQVLFRPGVHMLRDPRTGVWNFSPDLGNIPTPDEFAFHRLPQYITASQDEELAEMAQGDGLKYFGSTSTLTQSMSQIYFAMSGGRGVDISTISKSFDTEYNGFTVGAQLPAIVSLKLLPNGRYAIDNDKRYNTEENILSDYGRILEKLLTSSKRDFDRFLTSAPESAVPTEERTAREAYCYARVSARGVS